MTPTPRLAMAMAVAAALLIAFGPIIGAIALAVIAAAYAVDVTRLRKPPDIAREAPSLLQRLHPGSLTVTATGAAAATARLLQPTVPDVEIVGREGAGRVTAQILARRRGHHTLPPVAVRSFGPLGMASRDHEMGGSLDITVYPDVIGAKRIARAVATGTFSTAGRRRRGPVGIGTEFESIRDYTPDDDVRHINWRATLRTGKAMTNTYRIDQDRDVVCVIDTGRLMTAPIGPHTRLDVAVDAVAAIAHTADALGDRCGVVAFSDRVLCSLQPIRRGANAVVEAVHDLEPQPVESNYELAFRATSHTKRSLVVLFTDLFEEMAAAPLLEALPLLSRTHAVVVAYVRDDDLRDAVINPGHEDHGPYRAIVALDALNAHRRAAERLRHRGVTVVEASAGSLPRAAVGAYLDLKQRAVV